MVKTSPRHYETNKAQLDQKELMCKAFDDPSFQLSTHIIPGHHADSRKDIECSQDLCYETHKVS